MHRTITLSPDRLAAVEEILNDLDDGESATLTGRDGKPLAVLVSLGKNGAEKPSDADWPAAWDGLVRQLDRSWTGGKTALQDLLESRR